MNLNISEIAFIVILLPLIGYAWYVGFTTLKVMLREKGWLFAIMLFIILVRGCSTRSSSSSGYPVNMSTPDSVPEFVTALTLDNSFVGSKELLIYRRSAGKDSVTYEGRVEGGPMSLGRNLHVTHFSMAPQPNSGKFSYEIGIFSSHPFFHFLDRKDSYRGTFDPSAE